jgi:DNA-binding CsgD family transcriptional regulator
MPLPQKARIKAEPSPPHTYPLGQSIAPPKDERMMALLALSHTPIEHELYAAMLRETQLNNTRERAFSLRELMQLTGLNSYTSIRRSLQGLQRKLSIENCGHKNGKGESTIFCVYHPEEIFSQRLASGLAPFPQELDGIDQNFSYSLAIKRIVQNHNLSRREAQVALLCTKGLTNADIGRKLRVSEQTVKYHLRHIFIKFGVRRRAELISSLLRQQSL